MSGNFKVLWLVLARSGSRGIPHKNVKPLGGVPLLAYRVRSALAIARSEDVWISTDSEDYARIAEGHGATVPFLRPANLSADDSRSEDAVLHAMERAEAMGRRYDAVCILEPTSPFIRPEHLRLAVESLLGDKEAHSVVSVREVRPNTFFVQDEEAYLTALAENLKKRANKLRRQDFRRQVTPSGGIYLTKWEIFKERKTVYTEKTVPLLVSDIEGLEIDEPLDWLWAEFLIERKVVDISDYLGMDKPCRCL